MTDDAYPLAVLAAMFLASVWVYWRTVARQAHQLQVDDYERRLADQQREFALSMRQLNAGMFETFRLMRAEADVAPSWWTPTVATLVAGILADDGFDRCPVLADAMEDAGYENSVVLDCLRQNTSDLLLSGLPMTPERRAFWLNTTLRDWHRRFTGTQ